MKNITLNKLKQLLKEEIYRYDNRDVDDWGSEIEDAPRWEISFYRLDTGEFGGTAIISAATKEEARRSFFEDDLAFDKSKVRIGSIELYEED